VGIPNSLETFEDHKGKMSFYQPGSADFEEN
jgi:hypothetical protein